MTISNNAIIYIYPYNPYIQIVNKKNKKHY